MASQSWSPSVVAAFLREHGFEEHVDAFVARRVDGKQLLEMTDKEMKVK